jgi:hypothetical protein
MSGMQERPPRLCAAGRLPCDATEEMTIRLAGVHTVDAGWFVL